MLTVIFFIGLYIFLRLRFIKAGRIVFILFLVLELFMLITNLMQWLYSHLFYLMFFLLTFTWFIFSIKSYLKSRRRDKCEMRTAGA